MASYPERQASRSLSQQLLYIDLVDLPSVQELGCCQPADSLRRLSFLWEATASDPYPVVVAVLAGGQADSRGLRTGDHIVAVNGLALRLHGPTAGSAGTSVLLRGGAVTLTVERSSCSHWQCGRPGPAWTVPYMPLYQPVAAEVAARLLRPAYMEHERHTRTAEDDDGAKRRPRGKRRPSQAARRRFTERQRILEEQTSSSERTETTTTSSEAWSEAG